MMKFPHSCAKICPC